MFGMGTPNLASKLHPGMTSVITASDIWIGTGNDIRVALWYREKTVIVPVGNGNFSRKQPSKQSEMIHFVIESGLSKLKKNLTETQCFGFWGASFCCSNKKHLRGHERSRKWHYHAWVSWYTLEKLNWNPEIKVKKILSCSFARGWLSSFMLNVT